MTTVAGLGDNGSHMSVDSYDLATTSIMWVCTDHGLGDDGAADVRSRVNSRVYKGGKVSS